MKFVLSDKGFHGGFRPLSLTRSIADFRIGILTMREKWEKYLGEKVFVETEPYLQSKYQKVEDTECVVIPSVLIPDYNIVKAIKSLESGRLVKDGFVLASVESDETSSFEVEYQGKVFMLKSLTDIFSFNGMEINKDFGILTAGRKSQEISNTNVVFGKYPLFVENGCSVECATFNTNDGPIYIGANAEVMEGVNIRGPFALCEHAVLKMGAKMYGDTTVGPWCKVGGELSNVVFFGYSNKAHDGFLGNSVVGEWCNFGADSNNSNLKNNYAEVKLWNYDTQKFEKTGLQFCGLIFGDHSKCGINTMFNTGTVVGVSANIFGAGFPRNFVPSFSWGGASGFTEYKLETAFEVMERVMARRHVEFSDTNKAIMKHIFDSNPNYR
ncbi:MAG: GlmU family protein [Bacteroidales bacterium]|nr:GlmU family protein [Bacteroidales bacterium]